MYPAALTSHIYIYIYIDVFVESKSPEKESSDTNTTQSADSAVDLNQILLINDEEKKHIENEPSESAPPKQSSLQSTSIKETTILNGVSETHGDKNDINNVRENCIDNVQKSDSNTCQDIAAVVKPNLNGEVVKKTRRNGVHAYETMANGDVKEATAKNASKTVIDTECREQTNVDDAEQHNGF